MDNKHVSEPKAPTVANRVAPAGVNDAHRDIRLHTRTEAAQFLKVSVNTVDRLRYQRALPFYRIGGSVRFGP